MKIKIVSKHLQQTGNLGFVQFATLEGEGLAFLPAGPALDEGKLLLKEVVRQGVVGTILAINNTPDFLLLTDMDILKGARQNRVVNLSVLLAPLSKTQIDVSCIERGRWSYNSPSFKMSPESLDHTLRFRKAHAARETAAGREPRQAMQHKLWSAIYTRVTPDETGNITEDYESYLVEQRKRKNELMDIKPQPGCNGLAMFRDNNILSVDLFGNSESYRYYFSKLIASCIGLLEEGKGELTEAEAFFKLDDLFDRLVLGEAEKQNKGAGTHKMTVNENIPGFELSYVNQLVHMALLLKSENNDQ